MSYKLLYFVVERQHADDGEWTEHWLQARAAAPYTRTTGGTAEGKCVCKLLQFGRLSVVEYLPDLGCIVVLIPLKQALKETIQLLGEPLLKATSPH